MHMRYVIFIGLLSLLTVSYGQELPKKTLWQGQLGPIRLLLRINIDSLTNRPTARFESPDQGANNIPVSDLRITADSVVATSAMIAGTFRGKFSAGRQALDGVWLQRGVLPQPITLKRVEQVMAMSRPQLPKPPLPYRSDSLTFQNADQSIRYGATLTRPATGQTFPAVVLITGSGPQDRDETLMGHKPFLVIADNLTRNGFAVLRVDDRGFGQTTGNFATATSTDFANDVLAAIAYLKTRPDVDKKRIGLIGHSEGGMIAPMVAVQSPDVAYIVSLAGVSVKGADLLKKQLSAGARLAGVSGEALAASDQFFSTLIDRIVAQPIDQVIPIDTLRQVYRTWRKQQPDDRARGLGMDNEPALTPMLMQFSTPWFRNFLRYDPVPTLSKLTIPVLAMNGEKDYQVDATDNLNSFDTNLKRAGNKRYKIVMMPGLNHLFQTAKTGAGVEYGQIEETFSPKALDIMTAWLKEVVK
ncbi:alpha/beta fold hydrolase [Fibrisoma montanum]|uniref:Alpha/beta fold hydrolase n=2 Tax=Fibrisoma montanum TaxID=2305895 RepID=A0A418MET9_9BACT|nr:alpha/beta fold hydrolase [Fibrisoma montanum]